MKRWTLTTNRFVVLLDILGFKDLVARETHQTILDMLYQVRKANSFIFENNKYFTDDVYIVTFSDSLILFSRGNKRYDFNQILTVSTNLMARMIEFCVPVKGALAYGKITVDKENNLFFGQPIIDSYLLGEQLSYLGIVAHHSINKYISNYDQLDLSLLTINLLEFETPFKFGKSTHHNIFWPFSVGRMPDHIKKVNFEKTTDNFHKIYALKCLKELKAKCSGSPRKYIDNTIEIIEKIL